MPMRVREVLRLLEQHGWKEMRSKRSGPLLMYPETMHTVKVDLPADLAKAAGLNPDDPSAEAARLLAVELYREGKTSLGRAAELCRMPIEQFMEFAARHHVSLQYGAKDLEEDRRTIERLGL